MLLFAIAALWYSSLLGASVFLTGIGHCVILRFRGIVIFFALAASVFLTGIGHCIILRIMRTLLLLTVYHDTVNIFIIWTTWVCHHLRYRCFVLYCLIVCFLASLIIYLHYVLILLLRVFGAIILMSALSKSIYVLTVHLKPSLVIHLVIATWFLRNFFEYFLSSLSH